MLYATLCRLRQLSLISARFMLCAKAESDGIADFSDDAVNMPQHYADITDIIHIIDIYTAPLITQLRCRHIRKMRCAI